MRFIEQGKYTQMKHLELVTHNIKENIRVFQLMTDKKRIEWKDSGVVSKFVSSKEFSWHKEPLKELLFDLGILVEACSINIEQLSTDQLNILDKEKLMRREKYILFSPNKRLETKEDTAWWVSLDIPKQLVVWQEHHKKLEVLVSEWVCIRKIAVSSLLLQKEKKSKFEFGTISLLEKKPKCLAKDFVSMFGVNELLNAAVVDILKIEELAALGFFNMSEIRNYREVTDVNLKFYLMEISKEKAMAEFYEKRLKLLSQFSINRTFPNADEFK